MMLNAQPKYGQRQVDSSCFKKYLSNLYYSCAIQINNIITLNSLIEASASITMLPASPLPLLELLPPRDARAAAESAGVVHREDGWRK